MEVTINEIKKDGKEWSDVRVMRFKDKGTEQEIIVLTNGRHSGGERGSFEGTVLYNSDKESFDKVGKLGVSWSKDAFEEVSYLNLTFKEGSLK